MAKPSRAFQISPDDLDDAPIHDAKPTITPNTVASQLTTGTTQRPAYRQDRKNLSVWIDKKAFNAFKAMVAEEGTTIQDYVIKMINQEFAKKGRPLIAK